MEEFCYISVMEETFEQFFAYMREPDEDTAGHSDEEIYEYCKKTWLRDHPGATVTSMQDLLA